VVGLGGKVEFYDGLTMTQTNQAGCGKITLVAIAALLLGGILLTAGIALVNTSRPTPAPVGQMTAAMTVIPSLRGTTTPTESANPPTSTAMISPTLQPGEMGIGAFVQVSGTGGDGLRLRQGAGLNYEMQFLGLEGEVFQITDGAIQADGYTWWFLEGSYDVERHGWAVSDYLEIITDP
jgi:hypothetical protein